MNSKQDIEVTFDTPKQARETYFVNGEQIIKVEVAVTVRLEKGCTHERLSFSLSPAMNEKKIYNLIVDTIKGKYTYYKSIEAIASIFGNRKFV